MNRLCHFAFVVLVSAGLNACSNTVTPAEATPENIGAPGIKALYGVGVTDTVDAVPLQAIVVEVRAADGKLVPGTQVLFEARASGDPARTSDPTLFVCNISVVTCGPATGSTLTVETTDTSGVAKVMVRLGHVAGNTVLRISSTTLPYKDSLSYSVLPGAAVTMRAPIAETLLQIGAVVALPGKQYDRYNNLRTDAPLVTLGIGNAISLATTTSTVTANQIGVQRLYYQLGALLDSTTITVLPAGRLVAWLQRTGTIQMFNIDGSALRTLSTNKDSGLGTFPVFDPSRQRVVLHNASVFGVANTVTVLDTAGGTMRTIPPESGFEWVIAQRQLADGTIMVVGRRTGTMPSAVWRIAANNTITAVAELPGADSTYNNGDVLNTRSMLNPFDAYGAADISADGSRVAYLAGRKPSGALSLRVFNIATSSFVALDTNARSPRWSPHGDQIAYLVGRNQSSSPIIGFPTIINADGTGRREVGSFNLSPGISWSPDGVHLIGRDDSNTKLRILNINSGANIVLNRLTEDYYQPDWR
ncbi:MAG: hypothetical protein ABJB66_09640 [Gemmatimonadaceae bacterium]